MTSDERFKQAAALLFELKDSSEVHAHARERLIGIREVLRDIVLTLDKISLDPMTPDEVSRICLNKSQESLVGQVILTAIREYKDSDEKVRQLEQRKSALGLR